MAEMTLYALRAQPGRGFHFGRQGLEQEKSGLTFPSDSLFAALVATVAEQEGAQAAKRFAAPFLEGRPPLRLSSLFPYAGRLPLLPLPLLPINAENIPRKFAHKVHFISPVVFARLAKGEPMDDLLQIFDEGAGCEDEIGDKTDGSGRMLQDGSIWLTAQEVDELPEAWLKPGPVRKGDQAEQVKRLRGHDVLRSRQVWRERRMPRVTVDRRSNASAVYQIGRLTFGQDCGLWLAVAYEDPSWQSRLEALLHHLGDRGIGAARSSGYGGFQLVKDNNLRPPVDWSAERSEYELLLSRYLPAGKDEVQSLQAPQAAYKLVTAGGWLASPANSAMRRRRVMMVAEGSVLPTPLNGQVIDVRPKWPGFQYPHPVYRSGFALSVPVQLREDKV